MTGAAAIALIAFADVILNLWTHNPTLTQNTSHVLQLLLVGNLINGFMNMPYQAQLAYRWTGLTLRANCVALLILVPAIVWATPRYGLSGAGWAWIFFNTGYFLIVAHFMYERLLIGEKWRWYLEDILYPLVAATLVVFCVRALLSRWRNGPPQGFGFAAEWSSPRMMVS